MYRLPLYLRLPALTSLFTVLLMLAFSTPLQAQTSEPTIKPIILVAPTDAEIEMFVFEVIDRSDEHLVSSSNQTSMLAVILSSIEDVAGDDLVVVILFPESIVFPSAEAANDNIAKGTFTTNTTVADEYIIARGHRTAGARLVSSIDANTNDVTIEDEAEYGAIWRHRLAASRPAEATGGMSFRAITNDAGGHRTRAARAMPPALMIV